MKFGSVCSGIEAASVAWEPMGWNASWFAEIEPFPSAVLNHHWPHVSNLGDMTMIAEMVANNEVEAPDVLIGGTPCQAFSVAGARKSLDDHRGQLSLEYIKLANSIDDKRIENQKQPSIIVWENVPGVLNTKDNAFGCFLGALAGESSELQPTGGRWSNAGCVFGPQRAIAWRILDAQYFGVAQRRRRVFVVASARKGFNPAKVLFEWEGVRRDIAPSRSAGEEATRSTSGNPYLASGKPAIGTLMANAGTKLWLGNQEAFSGDYAIIHPITQDNQTFGIPGNWIGRKPENGGNAVESMNNIAPCQTKTDRHAVAYAFDSLSSNSMKSSNPHSGCREVDLAKTLDTTDPNPSKNQGGIGILQSQAFGIQGNMIGRSDTAGPQGLGVSDDISFTLTKGDKHAVAVMDVAGTMLSRANSGGWSNSVDHAAAGYMQIGDRGMVRRLTPIECERLQGFPDNHTQIPYRSKAADQCPDGPRYAACGNSMAVPVMRWIGERIQEVVGGAA